MLEDLDGVDPDLEDDVAAVAEAVANGDAAVAAAVSRTVVVTAAAE